MFSYLTSNHFLFNLLIAAAIAVIWYFSKNRKWTIISIFIALIVFAIPLFMFRQSTSGYNNIGQALNAALPILIMQLLVAVLYIFPAYVFMAMDFATFLKKRPKMADLSNLTAGSQVI